MGIILIIAVVACRMLSSVLLNRTAKTRIKSRSGHYLFAAMASAIALITVICVSGGIPEIHEHDILHGIILGVLSIGEEFFLLSALECGSMAMTCLVSLTAGVLPVLFSGLLFGEPIRIINVLGALVIVAAYICIMNRANAAGGDEHEVKEYSHWQKYVTILFFITALVEIEEKSHTLAAGEGSHPGYYFVAFLTATVCALVLFLIRYKGKSEKTYFKFDGELVGIILGVGILKLLIYLVLGNAGESVGEERVLMISSSAALIGLTLIDTLVHKIKFKKINYLALVCALVGMVLLHF